MSDRKICLRMLEDGFAALREINPDGTPESRIAYLGDFIFQFVTYDEDKSEQFATKALEVCRAISDGKTFEYIADEANYNWFLLMCNMPFFAPRLNWGESIRGAWWDSYLDADFETQGLWFGGKQALEPIKFSTEQWKEFIAALLEFADQPT